ncbi:unnamed protein product [Ixodes persulcatus]
MKANGSSRGSLRPHYGGRAPPFLLAALLIGLALIGFCYYNLSSQYSALESQYRELQHRLDALLEKKDEIKNMHDQLKTKFEENVKNLEESEKQLAQRDREKSAVEKALRTKDDELMGKIREADTAAKALTGCLLSMNETTSNLSKTEALLKKLTEEMKSLREAKENAAAQLPNAIQPSSSPAGGAAKQDNAPKKEDGVNAGSAQDTTALDPDTHPKPNF